MHDVYHIIQREKISSLIFERHIYKELEKSFTSYGIGAVECLLIQELIDHDLRNEPVMGLSQPERRFLYEVYNYSTCMQTVDHIWLAVA